MCFVSPKTLLFQLTPIYIANKGYDSMPKLVVGMPVYNDAAYLAEAIESILRQSFKDFQLLVVDDGSTDDSVAIVRSFEDPRVKLVQHEKNMGRPYARNTILRLADADYLAWMDADDISLPQRLERQVNFLDENPATAICSTQLKYFNESSTISNFPEREAEICAGLLFGSTIPNPCSCLRLGPIRKIKLVYREQLARAEDYGFWVDALLFGRLRANILPESLCLYRVFDRPNTPHYHKEVLRIILERLQIAYTKDALDAYKSFALFDYASLSAQGLACLLDLFAELYGKLEMQLLVDLPTLKSMTNARLASFLPSKHATFRNFMQYCTWRHTEVKMCLTLFPKCCANVLLPYGSGRRKLVKKLCGQGRSIASV